MCSSGVLAAGAGFGAQGSGVTMPRLRSRLKSLMWSKVGPFRSASPLAEAAVELDEIGHSEIPKAQVAGTRRFNTEWLERFELENMVLAARAIVLSAQLRQESRGAHQREDFARTDPSFRRNAVVSLEGERLSHRWQEVPEPR